LIPYVYPFYNGSKLNNFCEAALYKTTDKDAVHGNLMLYLCGAALPVQIIPAMTARTPSA
jgi:hypothetical protein